LHPVITCSGLGAGYGRHFVLREVSFALATGTVTAIIGPNGSGKSSLLRVLAGALPIAAGDVRLVERSYRDVTPLERARHVAFVPQTFAPSLPLTVEEALVIARYPHDNNSREAVVSALSKLAITGLRRRQCNSLSGGELRKVLIAQGLAQLHGVAPAALLLDEPVAFLDPPAHRRIAQLVQLFARRDEMAVAMVLHDLELARRADYVLLLREGQVLSFGKPADVMTDDTLKTLYAENEPELEAA
jgi:iron complex transport system ATP-binding protein